LDTCYSDNEDEQHTGLIQAKRGAKEAVLYLVNDSMLVAELQFFGVVAVDAPTDCHKHRKQLCHLAEICKATRLQVIKPADGRTTSRVKFVL